MKLKLENASIQYFERVFTNESWGGIHRFGLFLRFQVYRYFFKNALQRALPRAKFGLTKLSKKLVEREREKRVKYFLQKLKNPKSSLNVVVVITARPNYRCCCCCCGWASLVWRRRAAGPAPCTPSDHPSTATDSWAGFESGKRQRMTIYLLLCSTYLFLWSGLCLSHGIVPGWLRWKLPLKKSHQPPIHYLWKFVTLSVTRWLDYKFDIGPLTTSKFKFAQIAEKIAKVCFAKYLTNFQKIQNICHSGNILPNQVTLTLWMP